MMNTSPNPIVHICTQPAWQAALQAGEYRHASLETEGFIHCSSPQQVLQVANRYYPGAQDLLLLWIDPQQLVVELRWDPVGDTTYPHIYGPFNLEAVASVTLFSPDDDGIFRRLVKQETLRNSPPDLFPNQGEHGSG